LIAAQRSDSRKANKIQSHRRGISGHSAIMILGPRQKLCRNFTAAAAFVFRDLCPEAADF